MPKPPQIAAILRQRRRVEKLEEGLYTARGEYRRLILEAIRAGHSQRELGRELDVSWQRIQELKREAETREANGPKLDRKT
ncbi:MAG TPA: hypothetical protein VGQ45_14250 [Gaiellales bacterium]|jgi:hypothetical protein|nr:hypothetical protein [Gaiellales bacterium]